jgi:hypothetical protein
VGALVTTAQHRHRDDGENVVISPSVGSVAPKRDHGTAGVRAARTPLHERPTRV